MAATVIIVMKPGALWGNGVLNTNISIYLSRNIKLKLHSANSLVSFGRCVERSRTAWYVGALSSNNGLECMIFGAKPGSQPWGCICVINWGLISVSLNF